MARRIYLLLVLALGGVTTHPGFAHIQALAIDPRGTVSASGLEITVTGTIDCASLVGTPETAQVNVQVSQFAHGQLVAGASGSTGNFTCTGAVQQWSVTAVAFVPLKNGPASVRADGFTFGVDAFDSETATARVHLRND